MGLWLRKMEQKYGRFAIPNITLYLIICYAVGYFLQIIAPDILMYLSLDPYAICHGQIWRLVTWLLIPPDSLDIFTILMLFFYYSIGTTLERTWGTFVYNFYLFLGMIMTIVGSFLLFGIVALNVGGQILEVTMSVCSLSISTYYICMSIFLAFAMTFPDSQVLLMFFIPIKVKWLGIAYGVLLGVDVLSNLVTLLSGQVAGTTLQYVLLANIVAVVFSLLNFIIFFIGTRKNFRTPNQMRRQREFKKKVVPVSRIAKHKCAICGRTQEEYPELEFRFCSKCDGNYEYCSDHLYSHQHVKQS